MRVLGWEFLGGGSRVGILGQRFRGGGSWVGVLAHFRIYSQMIFMLNNQVSYVIMKWSRTTNQLTNRPSHRQSNLWMDRQSLMQRFEDASKNGAKRCQTSNVAHLSTFTFLDDNKDSFNNFFMNISMISLFISFEIS